MIDDTHGASARFQVNEAAFKDASKRLHTSLENHQGDFKLSEVQEYLAHAFKFASWHAMRRTSNALHGRPPAADAHPSHPPLSGSPAAKPTNRNGLLSDWIPRLFECCLGFSEKAFRELPSLAEAETVAHTLFVEESALIAPSGFPVYFDREKALPAEIIERIETLLKPTKLASLHPLSAMLISHAEPDAAFINLLHHWNKPLCPPLPLHLFAVASFSPNRPLGTMPGLSNPDLRNLAGLLLKFAELFGLNTALRLPSTLGAVASAAVACYDLDALGSIMSAAVSPARLSTLSQSLSTLNLELSRGIRYDPKTQVLFLISGVSGKSPDCINVLPCDVASQILVPHEPYGG